MSQISPLSWDITFYSYWSVCVSPHLCFISGQLITMWSSLHARHTCFFQHFLWGRQLHLPAFHDRQGSSLTISSVIFGFPPRFFPTRPPWVVWWLAPLPWPPWLNGLALWKEWFWNDCCCALDTAALAAAILILFVTLSIVHKVSGLCWPQFHSRLQAKSYASCDATSPSHVP